MITCEECNREHRTKLEAKACAFRDGPPSKLTALNFAKPVGHEGPCH